MKKIYLYIFFLFLVAGCTKDISKYNEETKKASVVPPGPLFNNAVKVLSDGLASASVNVNIYRHFIKHWGQAVIQEEAQYDYITRAVNQAWWTRMYKDVLNDLKESSKIITNDQTLAPGQKNNLLATVDIMEVYTYSILVNTFGDIPYKDALDDTKLFPEYDDAKTVYTDLLRRLAEDISKLNPASPGFAPGDDIIFQGKVKNWVSFGNSLQVRLGMIIADVDNSLAKSSVEQASSKAITSIDQNAVVKYYSATPNNNPLYDQLVLAGRTDYIAAKDLMDILINLNDPRKPGFFGVNNNGNYVGGVVGRASNYSDMSKPSARIAAPDAPNVLLDYMEMEFLRAEAVERGYAVGGTAEEHYNNAIRASISYWGGSSAEANAYLLNPKVAYTTAAGDWRQKIGLQKWIGLYNRPFEGWVEMRRLDAPALPLAENAISGFPNRMRYPGIEQQLNGTNYTSAAAKIGGDKTETKLFWDIR
ncbi:MAG: SusD/RagB family nutrient-binding outer membrane lipoprotein [Ginsengibacter sp.]